MRIERGLGKLFRKKKNGKFVGYWRFKFLRREVSTKTKNRKSAEQFRKEYVAHQGVVAKADGALTVNDLLKLVEQEYLRLGLRSLDRLKSRIRAIGELVGYADARTFSAANVAGYIDERIRRGLAPRSKRAKKGPPRRPTNATINRELETLRRGFRLAADADLLFRAPKFSKLPEDNEREVHLPDEDYAALIAELREPVRLLVVLAVNTGWRVGRLLNLKWSQIDWDAGVIRPDGKQSKYKWVGPAPLFEDLRKALLVAQAKHEADWPNVPWVLHRNGRKVVNYRKEFERARTKIGRPDLHLHDARHHSASRLLDAGVDEARVMRILGHKTPAMLKRYRLVADRHIQDAGRKVDEYLKAKNVEQKKAEQDAPEAVN